MLCSSALVLVMHATCLFDCDKRMRLSAHFPFGKHSCAGSMFRNKMHPCRVLGCESILCFCMELKNQDPTKHCKNLVMAWKNNSGMYSPNKSRSAQNCF